MGHVLVLVECFAVWGLVGTGRQVFFGDGRRRNEWLRVMLPVDDTLRAG